MSHSIENKYLGDLRTESIHLKSSQTIITDAPTDNNGLGNAFSPTDLVVSALCSCITTVMGICAQKNNFELPKSTSKLTKIMSSNPRRISKISITIELPPSSNHPKKEFIEEAMMNCPVHHSLNPEIEKNIIFVWQDN